MVINFPLRSDLSTSHQFDMSCLHFHLGQNIFFLKFIWEGGSLRKRQTERNRDRETKLPDACNGWDWPGPQLGARTQSRPRVTGPNYMSHHAACLALYGQELDCSHSWFKSDLSQIIPCEEMQATQLMAPHSLPRELTALTTDRACVNLRTASRTGGCGEWQCG